MISVKYPTQIKQFKIPQKVFVVEAIRNLDEAIDILCEAMSPEEQKDPFAEDLCPYFGILWPAAVALSEYIALNPSIVKRKTVLELGAGLGLPSLVASHFEGDVLCTDYHPDVEEYFKRNCRHSSIECNYERLNWRETKSEKKYDVVMGSDVLYEGKHPREVAEGLLSYVKPGGVILLSDPGRNYLTPFVDAMNAKGLHEEMLTINVDGKEVFILKFVTEYTE